MRMCAAAAKQGAERGCRSECVARTAAGGGENGVGDMRRVIESVFNIFFSLLFGAIALAFCAFYAPETLESMQINASFLKDDILAVLTGLGTDSSVNVWIRFLVQDEQLVFMGFVILMRVLIALFFWGVNSLTDLVMPVRD